MFLMKNIMKSKNWIGHVVRSERLLKVVMEGRMKGKRTRGRPRMGMIDDLKDGMYAEMKSRAEDRVMEGFEAENLPVGRELMMMTMFTFD